jgi:glycosyltransferase involved in cell wall biosynthesis
MLKLFVVINCGPCAPFIGACLASLRAQTYGNWRAIVTLDPCGDQSYGAAARVAQHDRRIALRKNPVRRYALNNLVRAVDGTMAERADHPQPVPLS